jgi:hypothetical protein
MVACDIDGKQRRFDGAAENIIRWLADGGGSIFAVKNLSGSLTFNFNNERGQVTPAVHVVAQSPPGPRA